MMDPHARTRFRARLLELAGYRKTVAKIETSEPVIETRPDPPKAQQSKKAATVDPDRPHAGDEGESGRSTKATT